MTYDVVVVGAGLGGCAAAATLAEAGAKVLVLERGQYLDTASASRDHLAPPGFPSKGLGKSSTHVRKLAAGDEAWSLVGGVGGGTAVWGMQAWRFHPDDFRMASIYGKPALSSLADWPISYTDLEPWYSRAERELGVAGDTTPYADRSFDYPMPPVERGAVGDWLADGARRQGWQTFSPPLAVNSVPYDGKQACERCTECILFTCPVDAKNGGHNRFVPRALATGRCVLETGATVTGLRTGRNGRVTGVDYRISGSSESAQAGTVILAAGAIETARLLLLSDVGNGYDQVGRSLQGHTYSAALGLLPETIQNANRGPGPNVATTEFNHGNAACIGGAMMANDFVKTPLSFWRSALPEGLPRWGLSGRRAMRDTYLRTVDVRAPVQEIPTAENRVALHPRLRDEFGLPIAQVISQVHPETVRTASFMEDRLRDWLQASGAERTWQPTAPPLGLSNWFHQAGTCRMSDDPRDGVVDPVGRVHGHNNLFVADGSPHVTNGGFNPALTIAALALRTACGIA